MKNKIEMENPLYFGLLQPFPNQYIYCNITYSFKNRIIVLNFIAYLSKYICHNTLLNSVS